MTLRPADAGHVVEGHNEGLIQRHPVLDTVSESLKAKPCIPAEGSHDPLLRPQQAAELVVHGRRQVPVKKGDPRINLVLHQLIEEVVVELDALLVHGPLVSVRDHPAPGDGQAVGLEAQLGHEFHIVAVAVVVVVCDVAGLEVNAHALQHLAVRDGVPDGGCAAALRRPAFDLVGRRRCAPDKVLGKFQESLLYRGCSCAAAARLVRGAVLVWIRIELRKLIPH
mmetsp:Transcript_45138/g.130670  ORF Transcript_45138/g.130670 Transcript_45138/m.130670 type:complete len:224 (-) Transcript_45138:214-885(-)